MLAFDSASRNLGTTGVSVYGFGLNATLALLLEGNGAYALHILINKLLFVLNFSWKPSCRRLALAQTPLKQMYANENKSYRLTVIARVYPLKKKYKKKDAVIATTRPPTE